LDGIKEINKSLKGEKMAKVLTHTGEVTSASGGFQVGPFTSPIYLGFLEKRNGLGGGVAVGQAGQDQYLASGNSIIVEETSQYLLAVASGGALDKFVVMGLIEISDPE
jgi:hypothetical protein